MKEYYFETVEERNNFIVECYKNNYKYNYSDKFIEGKYIVKVEENE